MERSLRDIENVNRRWGATRAIAGHLIPRMRSAGRTSFTLLDIGAGSGAASVELQRLLREAGLTVHVLATDLQWRHLAAGRRRLGRGAPPELAADAFQLPFPEGAADWAVATFFFHHFSPEQNVRLLREFSRVARSGFVLADVRRHLFPLLFVTLAGRVVFESKTSIHDGPASVRQAYTPSEASEISERAVEGSRVRQLFPYRLLIFGPGDGHRISPGI
jgi:ubiquinone/menaquinone biosynthesis C-methylase UbiE